MRKSVIVLFALYGLLSAQQVRMHGALKSIMQGRLQARFDLQEIAGQQNIYGLGASENLQGEIIVIDSHPYISMVKNNEVLIDSTFSNKAALFAFSMVEIWNIDTLLSQINMQKLDSLLTEKIGTKSQPVTMLLKGKVKSLHWHVIDWAAGDTIHTHQKHRTSGLKGKLVNDRVDVVGFYSTKHKGILTHRNSNMHLHFINGDRNLSGHVDDLWFEEAVLKVSYASD